MVTWMQHLQHGKHPAVGAEVDQLKKQGWTVCPPKPVKAPEPQAPAPKPVANEAPAPDTHKSGFRTREDI